MKKAYENMLVDILNKKAKIEVFSGRQKIAELEKQLAEEKKVLEVHEKDIEDFCVDFNYELVEGDYMKGEPSLYLKKKRKQAAKK